MTEEQKNEPPSTQILFPQLIAQMDKYYGLTEQLEDNGKRCQTPSSISSQKDKLRILMTTFWEYPFVGGLQNYIAALKSGLEDLGHQVDVLSPNQFPRDEVKKLRSEITENAKQFFINRYGSYNQKILRNYCDLSVFEALAKSVDLKEYDIIHSQDRFTALVMAKLNQKYNKPLLFTPHGFMTQRRLKFNLIEKGSLEEFYFSEIDRQAVINASHIVILCEVFRPLLQSLGAEDEKMTTVYTGIQFERVKAAKQRDSIVITCVSRLRPRKGHKYLFEALALLKKKLGNVEVRIVGDGEMREELEKQVLDLQLKNVKFLGKRTDIPDLLSESDIFVLPTTSDTLPISVIEAMFAKQAILTTDCGGIPEIIRDEYSGLIAEPANSKQLAKKLLRLVKEQTLRKKLARQARNYAKKQLTVNYMALKIAGIYQSLL
ncbi:MULTISPECIES: glycosyltransferase family 4 protein [Neobacillus]|uniref:Glycosyltransferase family 4 protein n=2 Tax=Neobacillus citreus TaxID=2833578 RepID=A0A9J6MQS8_9BACI|nr:glycosyltransferase family 4 protein [Neobacillus citreus]